MLLRLYGNLLRTAWQIRVQLLWGLVIVLVITVVAEYAGRSSESKRCMTNAHGACIVDGKPAESGLAPR